ncbi:MgtC/SapB family protein [Aciduricibacillus chroicocephali]|uniref:MgtC/SapB family protein n=1 Tax=Aciduricibacillus chroicocephali TaxID=3054939 RepID=A0ABY9KYV3_9BACI|nr:MgtC/SapB family protein [Bacillaceae bacterium 44XB]
MTFISEHFFTMVARLLLILLLSGLIGFERELKNHSAGFRTHILVGIGSCLMMLLSLYGFKDFLDFDYVRYDPARIPSYVVSGVGFLGAGTIMVYGGTIRGLTTAASIWAVAGLGLVVGAGMYDIAVITTIIILLSLVFLNNLEKLFVRSISVHVLEIIVTNDFKADEFVRLMRKQEIDIQNIEFAKSDTELRRIFVKIKPSDRDSLTMFMNDASQLLGVENITRRV